MSSPNSVRSTRWTWLAPVIAAVGLTAVFWSGLWVGGGLIGGDTYSYYFPQKTYYAERIAAGEVPLWNPLGGHGYPLLAESQTAPLSPFNLVAYRFWDVNTAYNAVQILHYVLAFVLTWCYVRRLGGSVAAALLSALIFTYAWFPFRISLEWAIVTGAWLPAALWCVEAYRQTRWWRYLILLAVVLALQMFAGHFHLAFITQLVLAVYIPCRLWSVPAEDSATAPSRSRRLVLSGTALLAGFLLAAPQLLPTWELKQRSQRAAVGQRHDPGINFTPVSCWSQAVVPWMWYGLGINLNTRLPAGSPKTNDVEAHLYFGLLPLVLLVYAIAMRVVFTDPKLRLWLVLGIAALFYTPGWFLPLTKHLPGFSYFAGPGRFSLVTTLAVAVIAGFAFDRLTRRSSRTWRWGLFVVVFVLTTCDLLWVSGKVTNVTIVPNPPLKQLAESELAAQFPREKHVVRVLSRGRNVVTMLGVASMPVYLGIGPAEYYDPRIALPEPLPYDTPPTPAQWDWMQRNGVTHLLSFRPLDESRWSVTLQWSGYDRFLNRALGHGKPFYLYRLQQTRGRVYWENADAAATATITDAGANFVAFNVTSHSSGRVVLTELGYPGWEATIDGEPVDADGHAGLSRRVDVPAGKHAIIWRYRPRSFQLGLIISAITALLLAAVAHVRYWHPHWFRSINPTRPDA